MTFKKIFLSLFFLCLFPVSVFAKDKPQVLFINQVRGEECCSKGNLANLEKQVGAFVTDKIPAYFVLRYDALTNQSYVDYIKQQISANPDLIRLGLMIEITPKLAEDSGVKYHDTENHWYEAQNCFTIGYQKQDRKKIIDKLFSAFRGQFGSYPRLVSAWLIDTDSLNYMHDKYGVNADQITREQWGQDSYTLYGGPPHYPYPASRNWAFIPDFTEKNPVIMLRQTVTDPLYNYGETKKAYTTQPNDYAISGLDFEYFKKLTNQALFDQKSTGFALLGLENSMEDKYQQDFIGQVDYINEIKDQVSFPDLDQLKNYWQKQTDTSYSGKDLINGTDNRAEFVTTAYFRRRIRTRSGKTFTTDYRYYDKKLTDPYDDYVAKKAGYWIVPYALDYSHVYNIASSVFPETRNDLSLDTQPKLTISRLSAYSFNNNRMENYPYYMPEAIARKIDRFKSQVEIITGKMTTIKFFSRDSFGYPANIADPVTMEIFPQNDEVKTTNDSSLYTFTFPNDSQNLQDITLSSDKKTVKKILLFPQPFSFIKLVF